MDEQRCEKADIGVFGIDRIAAPFSFDAFQQTLPISLQDDVEVKLGTDLTELLKGTRADDTWDTYGPTWIRFKKWCAERTPPRCPLPAEPATVALYFMWLGQTANSYSVIKTASGCIFTYHQLGLTGTIPTQDAFVNLVRSALQRKIGIRLINQKEPLEWETVKEIALKVRRGLSKLPNSLAKYGSAIMVIAFCGFLRFKDMKNIKASDVHFYEDRVEIFLDTRKNDKCREGNVIYMVRGETEACPVRMLEWLISQNLVLYSGEKVSLFQKYDGWAVRRDPKLLFRTFKNIDITMAQYQKLIFDLLVEHTGRTMADLKKEFGTGSLRSGGASMIAATNIKELTYQRHGGWRTVEMRQRYTKETIETKLSVTRMMNY